MQYSQRNKYKRDSQKSPNSDILMVSERAHAQLNKQKACLDDNMKDLEYMKLITGSTQAKEFSQYQDSYRSD